MLAKDVRVLVRDTELYDSRHSKHHEYHVPVSLASQVLAGVIVIGPGGFYTHSGFVPQLGNPQFRKSEYLIRGYKHIYPLCQGGTVSLISSAGKDSLFAHKAHRRVRGIWIIFK